MIITSKHHEEVDGSSKVAQKKYLQKGCNLKGLHIRVLCTINLGLRGGVLFKATTRKYPLFNHPSIHLSMTNDT